MAIVIKSGDNYDSHMIREYMLESPSNSSDSVFQNELSQIEGASPGSFATTADLQVIYRMDANGEWVKVGGQSMDIMAYALAFQDIQKILAGDGNLTIKSITFDIDENGELKYQVILNSESNENSEP